MEPGVAGLSWVYGTLGWLGLDRESMVGWFEGGQDTGWGLHWERERESEGWSKRKRNCITRELRDGHNPINKIRRMEGKMNEQPGKGKGRIAIRKLI